MTNEKAASVRERVLALRASTSLTYREIARALNISESHAKHCGSRRAYESTLRGSREAKRQRVGVCERCGDETRYNGHGRAVSRLCRACNRFYGAEWMQTRAGKIGKLAALHAYLAEPRRFSEVAAHFDISYGYASNYLNRLKRMGLATNPRRGLWVAR